VLNQVFTFSDPFSSTLHLLLHSEDIKQAAVQHFQNFVKPALHAYHSLNDLLSHWQHFYESVFSINPDIYTDILAPISIDELISVLNSLPLHKAVGSSGITYKML
jgi:hypothetical protein